MQQFDITVPSVGGFPVHAPGRYIKYLSGSNGGGDTSLIVTPGGQGGNKIVLQVGQAYRVADNKPTPDSWTLANNAGGATIIGKVVIGDGRIDDNTMSGVVQVVDGGKFRTLGGMAFAGMKTQSAVAAQFSAVGIWNPPGNTKRLVIEQVTANAVGGAGVVTSGRIFTTSTQLGSLGTGLTSKLTGAAVSSGIAMFQTSATQASLTGFGLWDFYGVTVVAATFKPNEPVVILPGYGIAFEPLQVNVAANASFEWYEEPNV
jgi:hypothetical protein